MRKVVNSISKNPGTSFGQLESLNNHIKVLNWKMLNLNQTIQEHTCNELKKLLDRLYKVYEKIPDYREKSRRKS